MRESECSERLFEYIIDGIKNQTEYMARHIDFLRAYPTIEQKTDEYMRLNGITDYTDVPVSVRLQIVMEVTDVRKTH